MSERFAIYYAPDADSMLWSLAAQWLGRDPAGGGGFFGDVAGFPRDRLAALSVSARRYGFHATIKAPMALAEGMSRAGLEAALDAFGQERTRAPIGRLTLTLLDGFLALVPERQGEALTQLAAECVTNFDRFRRPMGEAERQRRVHPGLSAYQIELLDQYGYPYVLDEFRFHMTLTDRLAPEDREPLMDAAAEWFAPALEQEVVLDRLSLYHEPEPGAAFARMSDFPLSLEVKVDA